ncbi:MAG: LytTR family DNA-binding domain-containing protein [Gammaproteobacteria bacterium]
MKILIVDDEAPARERLRTMLQDLSNVTVVGEATNGVEALQTAEREMPDLILLDIRMPIMDGLETARHLAQLETPPAVIFTTAYDQFSLQAFDARAIAYLLKPIRHEKLLQALEYAARPNQAQRNALQEHASEVSTRQHICARVRDELRVVPIAQVIYFLAEQKYVTVCYEEGEVLIEDSLKSLESEFGLRFLRVHRNALVDPARIESLDKDTRGHFSLKLRKCERQIEVSRRMVPEVRRAIRGR